MKKLSYVFLSSLVMAASFAITSCQSGGGASGDVPGDFSFSLMFDSGATTQIYMGTNETLSVLESNADETARTYTFTPTSGAKEFIDVTKNADGKSATVTPKKPTTKKIGIRVSEAASGLKGTLYFTVGERYAPANTGYNFSNQTEEKTKILAELEKFAMRNYLTGITLFENGGFVRYSPRVHVLPSSYVTGYGFGLLSEGWLDTSWTPSVSGDEQSYLRSATSSDPTTINGWHATGSQVGDLFGYISSSFWGTKLNEKADGYEWYSVLAKDNCLDPIPLDNADDPSVTIHKQYRVYVKTSEIKYRTNASGFKDTYDDKKAVSLDDYMFTFKMLLTQGTALTRGAELATDTSYGFKGAYSYFRSTKTKDPSVADSTWAGLFPSEGKATLDNSKLGIVPGHDDNGDYIDFEFINPIDQFTAKYTLSSSLYTPIPQEFVSSIGGGNWIEGAQKFGTVNGSNIVNNVICTGPFFLKRWNNDKEIVFERNDSWFEYVESQGTSRPRYRIPGVHMVVISAATQRDDAIYDEFNLGKLDSTGIPVSRMDEKLDTDKPTKGDSTFKLNVNSCTQERWDELFLSNKYKDVKKPKQRYTVKPWMSNRNFLNGLFWSINRQEYAKDRGVNPSYTYFADSYMSDPINGVSYNSTDEHKTIAEDGFDPTLRTSNFGYSKAKAVEYFKLAVAELVKQNAIKYQTKSNPFVVTIDIQWMYESDQDTYGEDIANYFMDAFNDDAVSQGRVILKVNHAADAQWEQVYNDHLMVGTYDLGFGAISGNSLNPLNFLEVLKSDNSSGFTLNWGADTSKLSKTDPIVYEVEENGEKVKKEWSFDALWAAADHGAVVKEGEAVDSVDHGYLTAPKKISDGQPTDGFEEGAIIEIPFEFVEVEAGVDFDITRIELYLLATVAEPIAESDIEKIYKEDGKTIKALKITISAEFAARVNASLFEALKLQKVIDNLDKKDPDYDQKVYELQHPFTYSNYDVENGGVWSIAIYYNIKISNSVPTENAFFAAKNSSEVTPSSRYGLAK